MIKFDDYPNENKTQHNSRWSYIPDHSYRILLIGGSESGKVYLYAKDPYEAKYQFLIDKRESTGIKDFNDPKAFTEHSINIQDVCKNIEENIIGKKCQILMVFDDMIVDMINND